MNLENTQSKDNLFAAFAGESQAYVRYSLYAKKAKEQGLAQYEKLFNETAKNELAHAKECLASPRW